MNGRKRHSMGAAKILRGRTAGYSLIEVLVGISLLAVVALTITGLFIRGRKDVASGRNMTLALSLAQHVAEDMDNVTYSTVWKGFQSNAVQMIPDANTTGTIRINPSVAGTGVVSNAGATVSCSLGGATCLDEPLRTFGASWSKELFALPGSRLEITISSYFDMDDDTTTNWPSPPAASPYTSSLAGSARSRIDVTVRWQEGERPRSVTLPQARTLSEV